jgi:hypothetical protein
MTSARREPVGCSRSPGPAGELEEPDDLEMPEGPEELEELIELTEGGS